VESRKACARLARSKSHINGADLTRNKIYVIIIEGRAGEKGSVRMKSSAHDWRGATVVQEAAIGLIGGKGSAIHVKSLDFMTIRTTVKN
jgi:hypothetical protein